MCSPTGGSDVRSRAAFSLLEVVIVLAIVTVLSALAAQALGSGTGLNRRIQAENDLTATANRVLNELALELRAVNADPAELKLPVSAGGDPDCASDTTVYRYRVATGITSAVDVIDGVNHSSFHTLYETGYHKLVYNRSDASLTRKTCDRYGTVIASMRLCDGIMPPCTGYPHGGFVVDKIGNTLAMQLVLQTTVRGVGGGEDQIVHVSQAQVLFLRSTLNTHTGSSPYTDYGEGAPTGASLTTSGPQITFGHALNYAAALNATSFASTESQVAIFIQPPVGRDLDSSSITVSVSTDYQTGVSGGVAQFATDTRTVANGSTISFSYGGVPYYTNLVRSDRVAVSGCYTVVLQGVIAQPMQVTVTARTMGGDTTSTSMLY